MREALASVLSITHSKKTREIQIKPHVKGLVLRHTSIGNAYSEDPEPVTVC